MLDQHAASDFPPRRVMSRLDLSHLHFALWFAARLRRSGFHVVDDLVGLGLVAVDDQPAGAFRHGVAEHEDAQPQHVRQCRTPSASPG